MVYICVWFTPLGIICSIMTVCICVCKPQLRQFKECFLFHSCDVQQYHKLSYKKSQYKCIPLYYYRLYSIWNLIKHWIIYIQCLILSRYSNVEIDLDCSTDVTKFIYFHRPTIQDKIKLKKKPFYSIYKMINIYIFYQHVWQQCQVVTNRVQVYLCIGMNGLTNKNCTENILFLCMKKIIHQSSSKNE